MRLYVPSGRFAGPTEKPLFCFFAGLAARGRFGAMVRGVYLSCGKDCTESKFAAWQTLSASDCTRAWGELRLRVRLNQSSSSSTSPAAPPPSFHVPCSIDSRAERAPDVAARPCKAGSGASALLISSLTQSLLLPPAPDPSVPCPPPSQRPTRSVRATPAHHIAHHRLSRLSTASVSMLLPAINRRRHAHLP